MPVIDSPLLSGPAREAAQSMMIVAKCASSSILCRLYRLLLLANNMHQTVCSLCTSCMYQGPMCCVEFGLGAHCNKLS